MTTTTKTSLSAEAGDHVLKVEGLEVCFATEAGELRAVDGVSFAMRRGRILAIVGESGCGKSVTSYAILRLIQKPGRIVGGRILFYPSARMRGTSAEVGEGTVAGDREQTVHSPPPPAAATPIDITALSEKSAELLHLRGGQISMIFQEPMTALSPVHTVGNQICEAILLHQEVTKQEARQRAIEMLHKVGIPGAERRIDQYPFEMSGGMRQRVVIAMALVCNPEILIADEPTTALDVTIQAQIMRLIKSLQRDLGTSTLLITHDLGVVAQLADDVSIMYLGRIVERGTVRQVIKTPRHPYTIALLQSLPGLALKKARLPSIEGSVPSLADRPAGCPFHPRCPFAVSGRCDMGSPPGIEKVDEGHDVACLRWAEIDAERMKMESDKKRECHL